MLSIAKADPEARTASRRVLVVADWKADPDAVVAACIGYLRSFPSSFSLVVPAMLHGIDWVGDPYASVPCAERALAEIGARLAAAGLRVETEEVGDHDPVAAVIDAVLSQQVDEILACVLKRAHPLDLPHRAQRATHVPVQRVPVNRTRNAPRHRAWAWLGRGHCSLAQPAGAAPAAQ